ncbi:hypothetical protein A2U01_0100796, partial [Trifolium medium]|nr:hypothetical protein [Trifolium medium]
DTEHEGEKYHRKKEKRFGRGKCSTERCNGPTAVNGGCAVRFGWR